MPVLSCPIYLSKKSTILVYFVARTAHGFYLVSFSTTLLSQQKGCQRCLELLYARCVWVIIVALLQKANLQTTNYILKKKSSQNQFPRIKTRMRRRKAHQRNARNSRPPRLTQRRPSTWTTPTEVILSTYKSMKAPTADISSGGTFIQCSTS